MNRGWLASWIKKETEPQRTKHVRVRIASQPDTCEPHTLFRLHSAPRLTDREGLLPGLGNAPSPPTYTQKNSPGGWTSGYWTKFSKAEIPNLQDLMPEDLRWHWCHNNRNKVHNKCNAFNHSKTILPHPGPRKKLSSMKQVPSAKKVGDYCKEPVPFR